MADYGDLLTKFIAAATAGVGLCLSLAKLVSLVQRSSAARKAREVEGKNVAQRQDLDSFEKLIDALENDNARIREERDSERKRHAEELAHCEAALESRRKMVHDLSNRLVEYQLKEDIAKQERGDENGDPR